MKYLILDAAPPFDLPVFVFDTGKLNRYEIVYNLEKTFELLSMCTLHLPYNFEPSILYFFFIDHVTTGIFPVNEHLVVKSRLKEYVERKGEYYVFKK